MRSDLNANGFRSTQGALNNLNNGPLNGVLPKDAATRAAGGKTNAPRDREQNIEYFKNPEALFNFEEKRNKEMNQTE